MVDFTLRPMEPADGPAVAELMRNEAQTTALAISTHYRHDVYASLLAQHPNLFGVVATAPGTDGLVGVATAFIEDARVGGEILPAAHLENLKVRHDVRRRGLGGRLAQWRIDEARRRFGGPGVIATALDATNAGSLATARRWSSQILGPLRIVIGRLGGSPSRSAGLRVRPMEDPEIETVVDRLNAFYEGVTLFPPQTPESLRALLAPTLFDERIRHYRVVVDLDGTVVAGAAVTERFKVMTDHIERVPRPIELLARVIPVIPPDRVIRSIELSLAWHARRRIDAGRALWDGIRHEWADRATNVACVVDPRGTLATAFRSGRFLMPKVELLVPIHSPTPVDPDGQVYFWR
jgi:predicted N-acetyltransferase YhbS